MTKRLDSVIAEFIDICYEDGCRPIEIKNLLANEFGINLQYDTIRNHKPGVGAEHKVYMKAYRQRPYAKAEQRARRRRQDVREKTIVYRRAYNQRPYVKAQRRKYRQRPDIRARRNLMRSFHLRIMEIFDCSVLTTGEIQSRLIERFGINFQQPEVLERRIDETIAKMENKFGKVNSPIIYTDEGRKYKLNENSPYWRTAMGLRAIAYWRLEE